MALPAVHSAPIRGLLTHIPGALSRVGLGVAVGRQGGFRFYSWGLGAWRGLGAVLHENMGCLAPFLHAQHQHIVGVRERSME